jgi:hypothetical protein
MPRDRVLEQATHRDATKFGKLLQLAQCGLSPALFPSTHGGLLHAEVSAHLLLAETLALSDAPEVF